MDKPIRLLSYNIQSAVGTKRYSDYVTRSWRHVLPNKAVRNNLDHIADLISDFDIVALQEIDAGSIRSGYINQVEYLAGRAGFSYAMTQVNRNFGPIAQQSIGLLSRIRPYQVTEHILPGPIPGRGAMFANFGSPEEDLMVIVTHLSLGQKTRTTQMAYLNEQLAQHPNAILMGDTNCSAEALIQDGPLSQSTLRSPQCSAASFPSWKPQRRLDHILVSEDIKIHHASVLNETMSDHLPVAIEVGLPNNIAKHFASS